MNEAIELAIKVLATKAGDAKESHFAMQYAQAALNLAHTRQAMVQVALSAKQQGGAAP